MDKKREIWLDWMRVCACLMVMFVHSTEPFYLGGEGSRILTESDAWWVSFFDSFVRACVPLFVVASSYLLLPLGCGTKEFFRRRAVRILPPFIIWSIVYALAFGEPVQNFKDLLLNFNYTAGHLWFVYLIVGLYLLMPILSPWAAKVSKRELQVFIGIWLFTTLIPILRSAITGPDVPVIYGPSCIPMPARYPLWGEASWNGYGVFYYLSGFIGYLLMGLYIRKFVGPMTTRKAAAISIPVWLVGFAICFGGFLRRVYETSGGVFPIEDVVGIAALWETPWINDTIGVALMTFGWVMMFRQIKCDGKFYSKIVLPVSKASYGMYLCHMLILYRVTAYARELLKTGYEGIWGVWTTPAEIIITAVISFAITAVFAILMQRIPRIGKVIIG